MGHGCSSACEGLLQLFDGQGKSRRAREDGANASGATRKQHRQKVILTRYYMYMSPKDVMGEGASSICRRGMEIETGREVAIKAYKRRANADQGSSKGVEAKKFERQIAVLKELQRRIAKPADERLWHEELERTEPAKVFMQLIDYSKDTQGLPGPDRLDGGPFVITELASYSLKDYIRQRRDDSRPMSLETVRSLTMTIVLVVASLHAKGLVHLDLKPDNIMLFGGCLKLIDVDGCVKTGSGISLQDSSLSFTPCYCAPEWAKFLITDGSKLIQAAAALDVWSVGMTICELIVMDAALKPVYASFLRSGKGHRQASFLFLEWLSRLTRWTLPKEVAKFDASLSDLLEDWLLVCDQGKRRTLAEALSHPYVSGIDLRRAKTGPLDTSFYLGAEGALHLPRSLLRHARRRMRTACADDLVLIKGMLWKLNSGKDAMDRKEWNQRDMWITTHGHLCYFSHRDGKRLVLLDAHRFQSAVIQVYSGQAAFQSVMEVRAPPDHEDQAEGEHDCYLFACDSAEDLNKWLDALNSVRQQSVATIEMGGNWERELNSFKLAVKNRRMKVADEGQADREVLFRAKLWKVKADGNPMSPEHWFERDMWISNLGDLVYWSEKEQRELIYYTHDDVRGAQIFRVPSHQACRPWAFRLHLPAQDGIEFAPGEFAAATEAQREEWIREFVQVGATVAA